ncbi:hypothetical protein P7K49_035437 [Saguinus oedipus]|uniref:Uncharacterized protein n=1 Tax=Saguinus oedipus TaxID=9490 RepID=A0ABQ9TML5_SAGOE|nr:hypothetical protein P7K49_035437 [Saguinus oedipus]
MPSRGQSPPARPLNTHPEPSLRHTVQELECHVEGLDFIQQDGTHHPFAEESVLADFQRQVGAGAGEKKESHCRYFIINWADQSLNLDLPTTSSAVNNSWLVVAEGDTVHDLGMEDEREMAKGISDQKETSQKYGLQRIGNYFTLPSATRLPTTRPEEK